ncbi:12767_t:CDS:1, partial [Dentiscutata erythropus]
MPSLSLKIDSDYVTFSNRFSTTRNDERKYTDGDAKTTNEKH